MEKSGNFEVNYKWQPCVTVCCDLRFIASTGHFIGGVTTQAVVQK